MENNLKLNISKGNTKMGLIPSVSLPTNVCDKSLPCYKNCYAKKAERMYSAVRNAYNNNLELFLKAPEEFEKQLLENIPCFGMFRWFVSGDILNIQFLQMMVRIAKKAKNVKFLAFTKKYAIVNEYIGNNGKIPSNLRIVFSGWKGLEMNNPYHFPVAWMRDIYDLDERIPKSAMECGGNCSRCGKCWELKKRQHVYFNKH